MRDGDVAISCQNVWKVFGPKPQNIWGLIKRGTTRQEVMERTGHVIAVKDATFDVRQNEFFVVMGLSGCGKSTLIRCINRLVEPTRGKIFVNDAEVTSMGRGDLRRLRRRKLTMVFQNFGLLPHRTVIDNVALGLELRGENKTARREKALGALEMVGLQGWENHRISQLSGGMQQRVGLARSFVMDSEIVLMDEPFSALDPLVRRQMQDEFIKLRATVKKTVVFVTHDLLEALKLGDRIAVMKDGEIVQLGTPHEIVARPADEYVSEFVRDVPRAKIIPAEAIMTEPAVVVWGDFDVEVAMREMATRQAAVAFVTDSRGRLEGVLTMDQAIDLAKRGPGKLQDVAHKEFPSARPDAKLEEILPLVADSDIPIAILDERQHLVGVVTRQSLIRAMHLEQDNTIAGRS